MSERDELTRLLFLADNGSPDAELDWEYLQKHPKYLGGAYALADAVLAAGYAKLADAKAAALREAAEKWRGQQIASWMLDAEADTLEVKP